MNFREKVSANDNGDGKEWQGKPETFGSVRDPFAFRATENRSDESGQPVEAHPEDESEIH